MKRTRKSSRAGTQVEAKPAAPSPSSESTAAPATAPSVALAAFLSAALLWASFAPIGLSFLALVAPIGWLSIIARSERPKRRGYLTIYISGLAFWLLNLQGIRLAFWALIFGWIALSVYLAIYIPLFVGISRTMLHRWRWPLFVVAPVVWVGLEVARSFIITGYAASQLGHSQAHLPIMIQIADQLGGYGVSFVLMSVCVAVFQVIEGYRQRAMRPAMPALAIAVALLGATLAYGKWRLDQADAMARDAKPLLSVILLQENTPTIFDSDERRIISAWGRYYDLTREAGLEHGVADMFVWPESTFTAGVPWTQMNITSGIPDELRDVEGVSEEALRRYGESVVAEFNIKVQRVLAAARNESIANPPPEPIRDRPHLLLGCDAWLVTSQESERYNSAILVDPTGAYVDRYDKMHLVMFGEYIPLGPVLQFLADAFRLGSVKPGEAPKCFEVSGVKIAPNICFESMLPELVSWQVRQLKAADNAPDVLVNVTNDSWFWGSSILDHHLACSIFCAVENHRPLLAAANTGLTAEIDGSGRVLQVTKRMTKDALLAKPIADARSGLVQQVGYPFAWCCCLLSAIALVSSLFSRRPSVAASQPSPTNAG